MTDFSTATPIGERMAAKFRMGADKEANKHTIKEPVKVLISGHFIDLEDLPKTPRTIRDIAALQSDTYARHSQSFETGAVFKTGARAGEKRPDKKIDHYAIAHKGASPWQAWFSDGKMWFARGYRDGVWYDFEGTRELVKWIKESADE